MGSADVARLRFILSADSSGLKAGTKEASGSLKDMSSNVRGEFGRMDSGAMDWKGLKRSARSLRFVGRELGGSLKGGIGDVIGIATAGAGLGPLGAAAAVGAIGVNLYQSHQDQLEKDRTNALSSLRESSSRGLDMGTFHDLQAIAGDDKKLLDDLSAGMRALADAGPSASQSLKNFGKTVESLKVTLGIGGANVEKKQLALAGEKLIEDAGTKPNWGEKAYEGLKLMQPGFGLGMDLKDNYEDSQRETVVKAGLKQKYTEQHFSLEDAEKKANERVESMKGTFGGRTDKYDDVMGEYTAYAKQLMDRTELMGDPSLKSNKEKLTERLSQLNKLKLGGADETLIGRATKNAIDDYRKEQGGAIGMAGAATAGSEEAYSIVAKAQMGAAGAGDDTAATNAILQANFPELIGAVKALNPNWRRADSAT